MNDLYEFEQFEHLVMKKLLDGDTEELEILRAQYRHAKVTERKFSGVGFFSTFKIDEKSLKVTGKSTIRLTDIHAQCDELEHGMGFVLLVSDGMIDELEGATYDEVWPDHISNLRLVYLPINSTDTRDIEYVTKIWDGR